MPMVRITGGWFGRNMPGSAAMIMQPLIVYPELVV